MKNAAQMTIGAIVFAIVALGATLSRARLRALLFFGITAVILAFGIHYVLVELFAVDLP